MHTFMVTYRHPGMPSAIAIETVPTAGPLLIGMPGRMLPNGATQLKSMGGLGGAANETIAISALPHEVVVPMSAGMQVQCSVASAGWSWWSQQLSASLGFGSGH